MEEKSLALEQVVVTAMGIQKKMSSLTYSTQQISSSELTRAKEPNMINTLAGKTAGVQINKTANLGGSAKVVIRGARSAFASGNNQPLYVIDGVPMLNSSTEFQPESGRHRKHQHPERFFCRRALWFAGS